MVPVGADAVTIEQPPADVFVVNRMALADWLRRRPVVLEDVAVEAPEAEPVDLAATALTCSRRDGRVPVRPGGPARGP